MEAKLIDYKAVNFESKFEASEGTTKVTGTLSRNLETGITRFDGEVFDGDEQIGSFTSYWNGFKLVFNIFNAPIENIADVTAIVKSTKDAVEAQIRLI